MTLVVAILLALFVLPAPWGWLLVGAAGVWEAASNWYQWHWSRTRRDVVGAEALVGQVIEVGEDGSARVGNERWRVEGAEPGERARVVAVDGLTLVVERL